MVDADGKKSTVWHKILPNGTEEYILLPMDTELKDYIARMIDLVNTLKQSEGRALESIITDLLQSNSDTFRVVAYKDRAEPSLPLVDAATLIKRSVDMITAAAYSISTKRAYYASRYPKEVEDFLKKIRLGHTERGSFIVSMHVPVQPRIKNIFSVSEMSEDILNPKSNEPFERRVMIQLAELTAIAIDAANSMELEQFTEAIPLGLNANFCEALSDIAGVCGDDGTHFDINWAPTRSINKSWNIKTKFNIRPDTAEALRSAGQMLRKNEPELNVEICGYVVRLDSSNSIESGEIKIIDTLSSNARSIYLQLNGENYQRAIDAHKAGKLVSVRGNIEKQGKKSVVKDIYGFQLLNDEE